MFTPAPENEAAALLARVAAGDEAARGQLFVLVYDQLRQLAGGYLRGDAASHTLQPTALVHEAFLRMMRQSGPFTDRSHFLAVASVAMRQILTDHARRKSAKKRGGARTQITLDEEAAAGPTDAPPGDQGIVDVLALDAALTRLASLKPRQAHIVEMRCFGGLTVEEIAEILGLSRQMIEKDWRRARAWLRHTLESSDHPASATPEPADGDD